MTTSEDGRSAARRRTLDRLFLGACTAVYVALVAAVIAALRMTYGGS